MRTTVRIEDDLLAELKERARREKASLTGLLNRVIRRGLGTRWPGKRAGPRFREKVFSMGDPAGNLDKALTLAAALEDEQVVAKVALRK